MQGTRMGPYQIVERIGAGGMGEVWLAEDTRLGRKVAVKVLPEQFAADPERLARFEQEARAAAALNHPHIAVVHDIGAEGGVHFMVQEYLRGTTLREAMERGKLPLDRALDLGIEIAEALRAAHRAGIVHRDLKPENIFVTEDGHTKVLDFGLAKLTEMTAASLGSQSMSPTVLGTQAGSIMGTAGYMAPEQVSGDPVDQRADLFAFGCVLYEMVFGVRAFAGRNLMQTLDLIIAERPRLLGDWPADQPYQLQWILTKCLDKSVERRYQSAADVAIDLARLQDDVAAGTAPKPRLESTAVSTGSAAPGIRLGMAAVLTLAAGLGGAALMRAWWPGAGDPPIRATIEVDRAALGEGNRSFAISPDGQRLAYVGGESNSILIRSLSSFDATAVPGTDGADNPFFSPDGRWLGYFARGNLYKVLLEGGSPQLIAPAPERVRGAAWTDDDTILIGTGVQTGGMFAVPASGSAAVTLLRSPAPDGQPVTAPMPDLSVLSLERPVALPGGNWFLAARESISDPAVIVAISRDGQQLREIVPGWDARYVDGYLYAADRDNGIVAMPFDPARGERIGTPFAMPERVEVTPPGAALFEVASNGTLVYAPAGMNSGISSTWGREGELVWASPSGRTDAIASITPGIFEQPVVSPDGRSALVTQLEDEFGNTNIHVIDLERGVNSRLPLGDVRESERAIWSVDGRSAIFSGRTAGQAVTAALYRQRVDADPGTPPERLHLEANGLRPDSLTPDGTVLAYDSCSPTDCSIHFLSLDSSGVAPLDIDPVVGTTGRFSPDGGLLAYIALEGGRPEAFVRPFPGPGGRVRVSRNGAASLVWSLDGREIAFSTLLDRDDPASVASLMAAVIERGPQLRVTDERTLFEAPTLARRFMPFTSGPELIDFDMSPDGARMLAIRPTAAGASDDPAAVAQQATLLLLTRWTDQVKRLAPAAR